MVVDVSMMVVCYFVREVVIVVGFFWAYNFLFGDSRRFWDEIIEVFDEMY